MDRGQAHTLEAFVAALILVTGLIFATQATAVTPLSASTSNQHIENQQQTVARDLLVAADENGTLKDAVVYWNTSSGNESFGDTSDGRSFYTDDPPDGNPLSEYLATAFSQTQIAYNIDIAYLVTENGTEIQPMVSMGTPSDNAVTMTKTVVLFEDTRLTYPSAGGDRLADVNDSFYAPNVGDLVGSNVVYNVVEVRITVWRM